MRCPSCQDPLDFGGAKYCPSCGKEVELSRPDPLIGQLIAGRYKVTYLVAEGGMGRVYAAEQSMGNSARKVAIKVLLAEYAGRDQDTQRFLRECSTVSELEHPNTIKFYDFGETPGGDVFIVMEFLSGKSLAQLLKDGPLPPERVDLIVGQICGSLQEAHDRGIVHRDLKPDNIVITSAGGAPDFVKVLDFGIAKRVGGRDPKLTPLGVVLGSPPYMSPEQFTLQDVDPRSDIYSLGAVAYHMLAGRLPFEASDPMEWAALHMSALPEPILDPYVPSQMKSAIMRALSKDARSRPASMREFFTEFTLGAGSMPPGRVSSVLPPGALQIPMAPRPPSMTDGDDKPTAIRQPDEASAPLPLVSPLRTIDSGPPEISVREVPASDVPSAEPTHGSQGTLVIKSDAPPPARAKMTMPDLLPPTVRDPEVGAGRGGRGRAFALAALGLVVLGAIIGAATWFFYLRPPDTVRAKREGAATSGARRGVDAPPTPIDVRTSPPSIGDAPPPVASDTAAPAASVKEKLSPCQTAIFSAVSGECALAKRAYARCSEDSPYRASATRAVTGLCP
jgi:serine/threonine-protein kinase